MRTLKKTLSLVLVVAMVLGLCVVGASAKNAVDDFTDADKIGDAYYEAVGVMTGIGVIKGMGDGILSPTGNYTRAQAAKIITYMLIGEKAAESLVCTTAPFEDVAANHWAAGYIAFCVEKGIINGMSATTFDPEGQLTGFQWAKMLLCAVGFGSQGEFTGNSWSLNTAFVAHRVGLFDGDLAGADHVALQRQQAILYAFNVLTTVPQVAYAPGITGYIEGVDNYKPVTDLGKTLGESIYKLYSVTGVIVDNEGMGASVTYLDYGATSDLKVKADTGLDMMYHAARIWYVEGTKANTGVFVLDLAKVETTNCPTAAAIAAVKAPVTIGDKTYGAAYQLDVIDNSAIDAGKTGVVFYYDWSNLGVRSTVKDSTVIDGTMVSNANIKTDISNIGVDDYIIFLKAESTKEDGEAWYVYTPTATSGAVKAVNNKTFAITLTDGTVLTPSNLIIDVSERQNLIDTLVSDKHITPTYYFVLDTHGHYMYLTDAKFMTVAYYTGAWKLSSSHDAWSSDVTYEAQFVDVATGTVKTIPVSNTWHAWAKEGGYYDITDELYGDATYSPEAVFGDNVSAYYGEKYAQADSKTFSVLDTSNIIEIKGHGIETDSYARFDDETVTFITVSGSGNNVTVNTSVGVKAFIESYAKRHNVPVTDVTLTNMALVYTETAAFNKEATVVFAFEGATATGGVVFFPKNVEYDDWSVVTDNYWEYDMAYLNGEKDAGVIKVTDRRAITRGFYFYSLNDAGICTKLTRVNLFGYIYDRAQLDNAGTKFWINDQYGREYVIDTANVKVVDTRTGAGTEFDAVTSIEGLMRGDFWDVYANQRAQVAYMVNPQTGLVDLIYVVDYNLGEVEFSTELTGWTVTPSVFQDGIAFLYNDSKLNLLQDGTKLVVRGTYAEHPNAKVPFEVEATVVEVENGDNYAWFYVDKVVPANFELALATITSIKQEITLVNEQTEFTLGYKVNDANSQNYTKAFEIEIGDKIELVWTSKTTVADGTKAKATVTDGTADVSSTVTFDSDKAFSGAFVPGSNKVVTKSILADYTYTIDANGVNWFGFATDGVNEILVKNIVPGTVYSLDIYYKGSADALNGEATHYGADNPKFNIGGTDMTNTMSANEISQNGNKFTFVVNPATVTATNKVAVNWVEWESTT